MENIGGGETLRSLFLTHSFFFLSCRSVWCMCSAHRGQRRTLGVRLCLSPHSSFETGSLTEHAARLAGYKPQ